MSLKIMAFDGHVGGAPTHKYFDEGRTINVDISVAINIGPNLKPVWVKCRFRGRVTNPSDPNRKRSLAERVFEDVKQGSYVIVNGDVSGYQGTPEATGSVLYCEAKNLTMPNVKTKEEAEALARLAPPATAPQYAPAPQAAYAQPAVAPAPQYAAPAAPSGGYYPQDELPF